MKPLSAKLALNVTILGVVMSLAVILGSRLFPVHSVQAATEPEPLVVYYGAEANTSVVGARAGLLLQASGDEIFYLTATGERRLIANRQIFQAFGFAEEQIIKVRDEFLAAIPLAEPLTRLVLSEQGNLYWVMAGQRWLVNEWREGVDTTLPITRLDLWLQERLPTRLNLENGTLLQSDGVTYYLNGSELIPVAEKRVKQASVIEVPAGVLVTYQQSALLEPLYLPLAEDQTVAEVRQGPGVEYGVLGPIGHKVKVEGRSANSKWVQTMYGNQVGWLPASALDNPLAASLLPAVNDWEVMAPGPMPVGAATMAKGPIQ
jgi:hypothetical protein